MIEPTLTSGMLLAIKLMPDGLPAIEFLTPSYVSRESAENIALQLILSSQHSQVIFVGIDSVLHVLDLEWAYKEETLRNMAQEL